MVKRISAFVLSIICIFSLCSCVDQHSEKNKKGDDRIIAASPATAEICSKLKIKLVGVCDTSSELPKEYTELKRIGMTMSPDLELIKSLKPDCVLSPLSLENELKSKYEAAKIPYYFVDLSSVDGMFKSIEQMGERFGHEEEAKAVIEEHRAYMKSFNESIKGRKKPKVLILMGLPGSYIVATNKSYVGNLVELAGGENVYGDENKDFLKANTEDMKNKNPDIILRAAHAMPDDVKAMFAKEFTENDIWKHFDAVKNGRVYDLDSTLFNMSARFNYTQAMERLRELLFEENAEGMSEG